AINATKLERFYNLSVNNYQKTKSLFKIKNNYYVNFSGNVNVSGLEIDGIGLSGENSNNLVSVTRITNYNNEIITIEADVWN
ncbi:hypothetical protein HY450_01325, partial [Candidatus Pacearchaeota archaeon]|nr:hypothetical protein [Candidatus Pacearchaeota archaeon]